jgi:8-oxo-dGTP pyrophosphatase MutT (NUDIX family)
VTVGDYRIKVVTIFLIHEGKILLLKRSTNVRTMKGMWAGISGYLENEDPLIQALKEIREESGLSESQVDLLRRIEPLEARDIQLPNIVWIVHPFLFRSNTLSIKIDWEHDEYKWIMPHDLDKYKTVPKLKDALEKLLH